MAAHEKILIGVPIDDCAQEPIHTPGLIQPHGALIAADASGLVTQASLNCQAIFGVDAEACLSAPLAQIVGSEVATQILAEPEVDGVFLQDLLYRGPSAGGTGPEILIRAHRYRGKFLVEIEPAAADSKGVTPDVKISRLYALQRGLNQTASVGDLGQLIAQSVQRSTGYDRILVYRFAPSKEGVVIGEAAAEGDTRYFGLHFPASDIPPQARQLYSQQLLRVIPDVEYQPVAVLAARAGEPLDMSFVGLRAVSPLHIEYLTNMAVTATMTASILVDGHLWGMIVGHHQSGPLLPRPSARHFMSMAAQLAGPTISRLAVTDALRLERRVHDILDRVIARTSGIGASAILTRAWPDLAALFSLDGAAANLVGGLAGFGRVAKPVRRPPATESGAVFTERFEDPTLDWLGADCGIVGGALLHFGDGDLILFGRQEARRAVLWGGDPRKPASAEGKAGRLTPRKSFAAWQELVVGKCLAFTEPEQAAFAALVSRFNALTKIERERRLLDQLHESERLIALGRLAGGVAHDLNNLLAVVRLSLDFEPEDFASPTAGGAIARAMRAVESASQITNGLLVFARRHPTDPAQLEPAAIAAQFELLAAPLLQQISLATEVEPDIGAFVADHAQLNAALLNLVVNARDALGSAGGKVLLRFRSWQVALGQTLQGAELRPGDYVAIEVIDDGPGMSRDVLERAFDPFFTTKGGSGGSGLGLSIVSGFASASGGAVEVESQSGQGTLVRLLLPKAAGHAALNPGGAVPRRKFQGRSILVVDDREDVCLVVAECCRRLGFEVSEATSFEGAIALSRSRQFDVCLTDVLLGHGHTGFDVAADLRARSPTIKVVFMTGFAGDQPDWSRRLETEIILRKPFGRAELDRLFDRLFSGT